MRPFYTPITIILKRVANRFRAKKPSLQTRLFCVGMPVVRPDGREVGRCTVIRLPNFLGWIVCHIFLPMVLCFARESSANIFGCTICGTRCTENFPSLRRKTRMQLPKGSSPWLNATYPWFCLSPWSRFSFIVEIFRWSKRVCFLLRLRISSFEYAWLENWLY